MFFLFFLSSGCATFSPTLGKSPELVADEIALQADFRKEIIPAGQFHLSSYHRFQKMGAPLTIYIEGDGLAWMSPTQLSLDPTPRKSLVLNLAIMDSSANTAYLARPCQFASRFTDSSCNPSYWSGKRFSEEVIASMSKALDSLRQEAQAKELHLVGYSGGAAVAVLVAARRSDIASLRTIAGNLDPEGLNQYHHVTPFKGSLNALYEARTLVRLPQRHFVGEKDVVVPPFVAQTFAERAGNSSCIHITRVENATHNDGWHERWKELLSLPLGC